MKKIKIFESKSLNGIDKSDTDFRRHQVAEGKSIYAVDTKYPSPLLVVMRDNVFTSDGSKEIKIHLRTFVKEENRFLDGTWHMEVNVSWDMNDDYIARLLKELTKHPEYDIDIYEYGVFMSETESKDDIIFNWHNRHLGEIWIAEDDLEKNEELKMIFENKK